MPFALAELASPLVGDITTPYGVYHQGSVPNAALPARRSVATRRRRAGPAPRPQTALAAGIGIAYQIYYGRPDNVQFAKKPSELFIVNFNRIQQSGVVGIDNPLNFDMSQYKGRKARGRRLHGSITARSVTEIQVKHNAHKPRVQINYTSPKSTALSPGSARVHLDCVVALLSYDNVPLMKPDSPVHGTLIAHYLEGRIANVASKAAHSTEEGTNLRTASRCAATLVRVSKNGPSCRCNSRAANRPNGDAALMWQKARHPSLARNEAISSERSRGGDFIPPAAVTSGRATCGGERIKALSRSGDLQPTLP
ncbi:unnamed protein product, partial [Iphiclides podalirius]